MSELDAIVNAEINKHLNFFEEEKYKKGVMLCKEGEVCKKIYFVKSGAIRIYVNKKGREVTVYFGLKGDFITALDSFYKRQNSIYNIQVIEDVSVLACTIEKLDTMFESQPEMNTLGRLFMTQECIKLAERINDLLVKSAKERYVDLVEKHPEFIRQIPLTHIASYLGITLETLSRIRGKHYNH